MGRPVVVVHGGAGTPKREFDETPLHAGVGAALEAGYAVIEAGGGALDAAQAAVVCLEDNPVFNAGVGAVLTKDRTVEHDASLACGNTGQVGAVAAISGVRNPIELARAVLDVTSHVLMAGPGAQRLAAEQGVAQVDPSHHVTPHQADRFSPGTVGAVVLDSRGCLAAATSTGGVHGKLPGRVGDSPLFGAGTYADGRVAVSASGDGEAITRALAASDVARLVEYRGMRLEDATALVLRDIEGEAGLIALGADGTVALEFNAAIFSRGVMREPGEVLTAVGPGEVGPTA